MTTGRTVRLLSIALLVLISGAAGGSAHPGGRDEPPDEPERGFFGLTPRSSPQGVVVSALTPDGPAERAGLRTGDVILLVDGEPPVVTAQGGVTQSFTRFREGDDVELVVRREDATRTYRLTLSAVPPLTREEQTRIEEIERRMQAAEVVEEMFDTLDGFDLTFSKEDRLLFREKPEDEWVELDPMVAETFEGIARQLLRERKVKVLRLAVVRDGESEPTLKVVETTSAADDD